MGLDSFKETEGKKDKMYDGQFHKELDRELKGAERRSCNESYDIRETSVKGDPFCSSARKLVDSQIKASEKPHVASDPQLHSDTTRPGDNVVKGMSKGGFTESAQENLKRQRDKKVLPTVARKVFES